MKEAKRAILEAERADENARELKRELYVSDMNVALQEWKEGSVERVVRLLKRHWPQEGEQDLRGFEWHHLWWLCRSPLEMPTLHHDSFVRAVEFSPDGTMLASAATSFATVWDVATRREKAKFYSDSSFVWGLAFSLDSKWLASANHDGSVKVWNVEGGDREPEQLLKHRSSVWSVKFSPDGKMIASGCANGEVALWNRATGDVFYGKRGRVNAREIQEQLNSCSCPTLISLASSPGRRTRSRTA